MGGGHERRPQSYTCENDFYLSNSHLLEIYYEENSEDRDMGKAGLALKEVMFQWQTDRHTNDATWQMAIIKTDFGLIWEWGTRVLSRKSPWKRWQWAESWKMRRNSSERKPISQHKSRKALSGVYRVLRHEQAIAGAGQSWSMKTHGKRILRDKQGSDHEGSHGENGDVV